MSHWNRKSMCLEENSPGKMKKTETESEKKRKNMEEIQNTGQSIKHKALKVERNKYKYMLKNSKVSVLSKKK